MDAIIFLEERNRLCSQHDICPGCPLFDIDCMDDAGSEKELVEIVEKWSKEHPLVTNGGEVMRTLPEDAIVSDEWMDTVTIRVPRKWWDAEYKGGVGWEYM